MSNATHLKIQVGISGHIQTALSFTWAHSLENFSGVFSRDSFIEHNRGLDSLSLCLWHKASIVQFYHHLKSRDNTSFTYSLYLEICTFFSLFLAYFCWHYFEGLLHAWIRQTLELTGMVTCNKIFSQMK